MSPRYYLVSTIIVVVLTIAVSWWKQKKTIKEIFVVFGQVVILWVFLLGAVFGLAELLKYLGIAQSGFIIKGEEKPIILPLDQTQQKSL
jgi:hypothetical protein